MPEKFFTSQLESNLKRNRPFLMTKGEQIRDYLQIDDLLSKIIMVARSSRFHKTTVNICSGKGRSIKSIAMNIAKKYNKIELLKIGALPYRQNEIMKVIGCDVKFKKILVAKK